MHPCKLPHQAIIIHHLRKQRVIGTRRCDYGQVLGAARATGSQTIAQCSITIVYSETKFFIPEQILCIAKIIKKLFRNKINLFLEQI